MMLVAWRACSALWRSCLHFFFIVIACLLCFGGCQGRPEQAPAFLATQAPAFLATQGFDCNQTRGNNGTE